MRIVTAGHTDISANRIAGMLKMAIGLGGLGVLVFSSAVNTAISLSSAGGAILCLLIISGFATWIWRSTAFWWLALLAFLDCALLTAMIASFGELYPGLPAAMTRAPAFGLYTSVILMQALWRRPGLILFTGALSVLMWGAILLLAHAQGAYATVSYSWYLKSPTVMYQAEAEKISGLLLNTGLIWLIVLRDRGRLSALENLTEKSKKE